MQKNDYRRSLIVLRSMRDGYAGHARLERRTLLGDLFVNATARPSEGAMRVAFVGQRHGSWYAADGGILRRDSRGQVGGRIHFDPRNVAGHDLDEYNLMLVALPDTPDVEIAMSGSLSAAEMNWAEIRRVVTNLYRHEAQPTPQQQINSENIPSQEIIHTPPQQNIPEGEEMPDVAPKQAISASELHTEIHALQDAAASPEITEAPADSVPTENTLPEESVPVSDMLESDTPEETPASDTDEKKRDEPEETPPCDIDENSNDESKEKHSCDTSENSNDKSKEKHSCDTRDNSNDESKEKHSCDAHDNSNDESEKKSSCDIRENSHDESEEKHSHNTDKNSSDMPKEISSSDTDEKPSDMPEESPAHEDEKPHDTPEETPQPRPTESLPHIDGCEFVLVPLPACCHASGAMGFLRTEGIVTRVYYAISGRSEPEPPPGMEQFFWQDGWWLCGIDVP